MRRQQVTLKSNAHYGRRVPSNAFGQILEVIPEIVRHSVRMRFEGRSRAKGKRPDWLTSAADIRFVGHEGSDETVLHFESETLGEAAPRLYAQQELWPTRPEASDTGFDLFADVIQDITETNADSERFDRKLLESISKFQKMITGPFSEIHFSGNRLPPHAAAIVNSSLVEKATTLRTNIPLPRKVRIRGKLDLLRMSTQSFGLIRLVA